jgi:hypothetical protein
MFCEPYYEGYVAFFAGIDVSDLCQQWMPHPSWLVVASGWWTAFMERYDYIFNLQTWEDLNTFVCRADKD